MPWRAAVRAAEALLAAQGYHEPKDAIAVLHVALEDALDDTEELERTH
jgi:hypothetical protein